MVPTNPNGTVAYQYQPGTAPTGPADLVVVHERLEAMNTILDTAETRRLLALDPTTLPVGHPDLLRLDQLTSNSCAEASARLADVVAGRAPPEAIDLSQPISQMDSRDLMYRINGDASVTLPGSKAQLHQELAAVIATSGERGVGVINRTDGDPGHVFYAENIHGNVWLFEPMEALLSRFTNNLLELSACLLSTRSQLSPRRARTKLSSNNLCLAWLSTGWR